MLVTPVARIVNRHGFAAHDAESRLHVELSYSRSEQRQELILQAPHAPVIVDHLERLSVWVLGASVQLVVQLDESFAVGELQTARLKPITYGPDEPTQAG